MFAHLALVLVAGIYLPPALVAGSRTSRGCWDEDHARSHPLTRGAVDGHRPWPRAIVDDDGWHAAIDQLAAGRVRRCSACGARRAPCTWRCSTRPGDIAVLTYRLPGRPLSVRRRAASAGDPAGARDRAISSACEADRRARHAALARSRRLGRRASARQARSPAQTRRALCVPAGRGREPAPDSGRPGACRHHRARPFPLHRQRRDRRAAGGAARLCPQGHRRPDGRRRRSSAPRSSPAAPPATARSPMPSPSPAPSRRRSQVEPPPRAVWLRALMAELERLANHLGDIGAICNDASFALMHAHCGVLRERVLRAADACFGHRLMMDAIVPGGVARDLARGRRRGAARAARRDPQGVPAPGRALRQHRLAAGPHRRHRHRRSRSWRASSAPAAMSAAPPAATSTRAARSAMRPMTTCRSRCRCSRRATSTRASGSASARSSRAWR